MTADMDAGCRARNGDRNVGRLSISLGAAGEHVVLAERAADVDVNAAFADGGGR